jgi:DNA repair protein RecO (recombination protein O)
VLTPEHGKITVSAVGARRTRSRFVGCTELLCYSEMQLYKTRDSYRLIECSIIEPFSNICKDFTKLTYATYFSEIIYDIVLEECSAKDELKLLLNSLHYLSSTKRSPKLINSIFELRILSINGMSPIVSACLSCNRESNYFYFSYKECGVLCNDCLGKDLNAYKISTGTYTTLKHIVKTKFSNLFKFEVSEEVLSELSTLSKRFLRERLEKTYKSLEFLEKL